MGIHSEPAETEIKINFGN